MNKLRVKDCVLIDCISYTSVSMLLSALAYFSDPDLVMSVMDHIAYLQLFACTTTISVLMYFTSKLPVKSQIAAAFLSLLDIAAVIYGIGGGVFKWFPWRTSYIIEVGIILTLVFLVTNWIMMWQNREIAKAINKKLQERE